MLRAGIPRGEGELLMLSKKRQFMFEALAARTRATRMPEPIQAAPQPVIKAPVRLTPKAKAPPRPPKLPKAVAPRRPRRRIRSLLQSLPALPSMRGGAWWLALGGVVLMSVAFVVHRV